MPTAMPMSKPKPKPKNPPFLLSAASKPRKPSPSPSPSPATAAKPWSKNQTPPRRSPLSDLNSGDASAARPGCFRFLLSSSSSSSSFVSSSSKSKTKCSRTAGIKPRPRTKKQEVSNAKIKKQEAAEKQESAGRLEALTPERKADAAGTPASGATPPIHASISPEVVAGAATPACFAAGHHVVPGVGDRRKCRPRGILAIAGEGASEEIDAEPSRASIQWLSSPSGVAGTCSTKCGNEASVKWLVSPCDEGCVDLLKDEIFVPRCSSEDAFWRFSPDSAGYLGSPVLGGLLDFGTPALEMSERSSGFVAVQKTPSTGDSISPFSLIVKRASQSSRLRSSSVHCRQQVSSCRNGSAEDRTPLTGESWPENVIDGMCSELTTTGGCLATRMDIVVECFKIMSLSPKTGDDDYDKNSALPGPLPELSFQFAHAPTPLDSIDLSSFIKRPCDTDLKGKEASFRKPALPESRISWREGLVSRMFDIGDLDCCKWLSDDDEPFFGGKDEALPDTKFQSSHGSCLKEARNEPAERVFGSVEFNYTDSACQLNNDCKVSPTPISVAESMRAEGFELVSSDDSDWTLFYKNDLFEL